MKYKISITALIGLFAILTVAIPSAGRTTIGGAIEKNFTDGALGYGGYLRTGGLFAFELGGMVPQTGSSSSLKAFSYLLLNLNLATLPGTGGVDMFVGVSPDITIDTGQPSFTISDSSAYGKSGLQLNLDPFALQVQGVAKFKLTGEIESLAGGLGIGFTF